MGGYINSGYVILPGEDIEQSSIEPLDGDQRQAVRETLEARRLQELLRAATG